MSMNRSKLTGVIEEGLSMEGAALVADVAVHPGEDSSLDRTWGGSKGRAVRSTATAQAVTGPGVLYGLCCTAGTAPTISLYDGTSAAGVLLYTGPTGGLTIGQLAALPCALEFTVGLYAVVGGTTPAFTLYADN